MFEFEYPVVSVHIPVNLRRYVDGYEEVIVSGETVGDLLAAVGHEHPSILPHLISAEGGLAEGLTLYLGGREITGREGLATEVAQEEVLSIVPAMHVHEE